MKKANVIIMMILALALVSGCVHTQQGTGTAPAVPVLDRISQRGVLVVGTAGSMPPFNMTTREGDVIGIEPDMAKLMAERSELVEVIDPDLTLKGLQIILERVSSASYE